MSFLLFVLFAVSAAAQSDSRPEAWVRLSQLAQARIESDDLKQAESYRRQALALAEESTAKDDIRLAPLLTNLALTLHLEARDAEADPLLRRALMITEDAGDRLQTASVLNALGIILHGEGEVARAEPVLRRSLALLQETCGQDSLAAGKAANNLAVLYIETGQYAPAEQQMRNALGIYEKHLDPNSPELAVALGNMFLVLVAQHRISEAEPYLSRAIAIGQVSFPGSIRMATLEERMAELEGHRGNLKEAARLLEGVIKTEERLLGPDHPKLAKTLSNYSNILSLLHQKTEAKRVKNRADTILKSYH